MIGELHAPVDLLLEKGSLVSLKKRVGGPYSQSGQDDENENPAPTQSPSYLPKTFVIGSISLQYW